MNGTTSSDRVAVKSRKPTASDVGKPVCSINQARFSGRQRSGAAQLVLLGRP